MRAWGVCCLAVTGCFFGSSKQDPPPAVDPALLVAVGATITPELDVCSDVIGPRGEICLENGIDGIANVTVDSDAFSVAGLPYEDEHHDYHVKLTALRAGDATLTFEWKSGSYSVKQSVPIRAMDVTHTKLAAQCDGRTVTPDDGSIAIAAGLSFYFETIAMHDDLELLSGDLELVEQVNGFVLTPPTPGNDRMATSPTVAGTYTWTLVGGVVETFVVYAQAALEPALSPLTAQGTITLGRKVGDAIVCKHGRRERALVEVIAGTCLPATSVVEVAGPMPVDLGSAPFSFQLASGIAQSCTVRATVESTGTSTLATYTVGAPPPPPASGTPIGTTAQTLIDPRFTVGASCGASPTDGNCDGTPDSSPLTDPDCYSDSDWKLEHADSLSSGGLYQIPDTEYVGVGLTSLVKATITTDLLGAFPVGVGPPRNIMVTAPAEVSVQNLACHNDVQVLALTPSTANATGHALTMTAENLDDTGTFKLRTKPITSVLFGKIPAGSRSVIAGSIVDVRPTFKNGVDKVRGATTVTIAASSGGTASLTAFTDVYLETPGTTVTVNATGPGSTLTLTAVGLSAITSIGGLFNDSDTIGQMMCATLVPLGTGNSEIHGNVGRARLQLSGSSLVMGADLGGKLCMVAHKQGVTSLMLTWGSASATSQWSAN